MKHFSHHPKHICLEHFKMLLVVRAELVSSGCQLTHGHMLQLFILLFFLAFIEPTSCMECKSVLFLPFYEACQEVESQTGNTEYYTGRLVMHDYEGCAILKFLMCVKCDNKHIGDS